MSVRTSIPLGSRYLTAQMWRGATFEHSVFSTFLFVGSYFRTSTPVSRLSLGATQRMVVLLWTPVRSSGVANGANRPWPWVHPESDHNSSSSRTRRPGRRTEQTRPRASRWRTSSIRTWAWGESSAPRPLHPDKPGVETTRALSQRMRSCRPTGLQRVPGGGLCPRPPAAAAAAVAWVASLAGAAALASPGGHCTRPRPWMASIKTDTSDPAAWSRYCTGSEVSPCVYSLLAVV